MKNNFPCQENQAVAAPRNIPVTIARDKIERLEAVAEKRGLIIDVLPYKNLKAGQWSRELRSSRGMKDDKP